MPEIRPFPGDPLPRARRRAAQGARAALRRDPAGLPAGALRARPAQRRAAGAEPDARATTATATSGRRTGAGGRRGCSPRTREPCALPARADVRGGGPARCAASGCWPASGPRIRGGSVLPHEQTRAGGEGGPLPRAEGHARQLQPDLPDVPRRRRALRQRGRGAAATGRAALGLHRRRRRRATGSGASPTPAVVAEMQAILAAQRAYIADGHHRYATALRYRDEVGPEGAWTLGYFTPLEAPRAWWCCPTTACSPRARRRTTARRALQGHFRVTRRRRRRRGRRAAAARSSSPYAFGLAWPGGGALVAEALPEAQRLMPETAPPACARSTPTCCTRPCCRTCCACPPPPSSYVHSLREAEEAVASGPARAGRADAPDAGAAGGGRGGGARVHAGQEHVLPSEAAVRPGHPPAARLTEGFREEGGAMKIVGSSFWPWASWRSSTGGSATRRRRTRPSWARCRSR